MVSEDLPGGEPIRRQKQLEDVMERLKGKSIVKFRVERVEEEGEEKLKEELVVEKERQ